MKVKLLVDAGGHEIGETVDAIRFRDFTPEQVNNNTNHPKWWSGDEIFILRTVPFGKETHLYMIPEVIKIIEE